MSTTSSQQVPGFYTIKGSMSKHKPGTLFHINSPCSRRDQFQRSCSLMCTAIYPIYQMGKSSFISSLFLLTLSIKMERSTVMLGVTTFQFTTDHIYNCGILYRLDI